MAIRYDLDLFDRHSCLRPPIVLLAGVAFLCRDFLLPVAGAATRLVAGGNLDLRWVYDSRQPYWFLAQLPALAVLYAWVRRSPGGDAAARWIWRHARWLLIASAVVQSLPLLGLLRPGAALHVHGETVAAGLGLVVALYVALNRRVRDSLADFPARP